MKSITILPAALLALFQRLWQPGAGSFRQEQHQCSTQAAEHPEGERRHQRVVQGLGKHKVS